MDRTHIHCDEDPVECTWRKMEKAMAEQAVALMEIEGRYHEANARNGDLWRTINANNEMMLGWAKILNDVADALKGPAPQRNHDWSDLPEWAARVVAQREELLVTVEDMVTQHFHQEGPGRYGHEFLGAHEYAGRVLAMIVPERWRETPTGIELIEVADGEREP